MSMWIDIQELLKKEKILPVVKILEYLKDEDISLPEQIQSKIDYKWNEICLENGIKIIALCRTKPDYRIKTRL